MFDAFIFVVNLLGPLLSVAAVHKLELFLIDWNLEESIIRASKQAGLETGFTIENPERAKLLDTYVGLIGNRFSDDLFKNRISDLCFFVRNIWMIIGGILETIVFFVAVWRAFEISERELFVAYSAKTWVIVGIALLFWIIGTIFTFLCRLLTGRYPGQAMQMRMRLGDYKKIWDPRHDYRT